MKPSQKTFLKGALSGAALMDWRNSVPSILFGAFLCFLSAMFLLGVTQIPEISGTLQKLEVQTPAEVQGETGLVKIQDLPTVQTELVEPTTGTPVLYYHLTESEYKYVPVEKQRHIEEEGQTRTENYTDYELKWVVTNDASHWANFSLGSIEIENLDQAKLAIETSRIYEETTDLKVDLSQPKEALANVPQQKKIEIDVLMADQPIIVAGLISENKIQSPADGIFVISNKTDGQLIEDLKMEETNTQNAALMGAWFLLTTGLFFILLPVIRIINIIPGAGFLTGLAAYAILGTACGVLIYFVGLGLRYEWATLGIVVGLGIAVILKRKATLRSISKS